MAERYDKHSFGRGVGSNGARLEASAVGGRLLDTRVGIFIIRVSGMNDGFRNDCLENAERLVDEGDYQAALDALRDLADDPSGSSHALMGLACFHLEDYAAAVGHYDAALACAPARTDWRALREHADANAVARIHDYAPQRDFFDRDALLKRPEPGLLCPLI